MILVCGDVHAEFKQVNSLINSNPEISMIIQCGDFGWWPKEHGKSYLDSMGKIHFFDQYSLKNKDVEIRWCKGNHEDHEDLEKRTELEVMPKVFYQPNGSTIKLPDGRIVLFMGGAFSVDHQFRTAGYDWFPHLETVSQKDIYNLPDVNVDIVISHICPREFYDRIKHLLDPHWEKKGEDSSLEALSIVLKKYKPQLWYFGHFHIHKEGFDNGCRWITLSAPGFGKRWWEYLKN